MPSVHVRQDPRSAFPEPCRLPSALARVSPAVSPGHGAVVTAAFGEGLWCLAGDGETSAYSKPGELRSPSISAASEQVSSAPSPCPRWPGWSRRGDLVKPAAAATPSCSWKRLLCSVLFNCSCRHSKRAEEGGGFLVFRLREFKNHCFWLGAPSPWQPSSPQLADEGWRSLSGRDPTEVGHRCGARRGGGARAGLPS